MPIPSTVMPSLRFWEIKQENIASLMLRVHVIAYAKKHLKRVDSQMKWTFCKRDLNCLACYFAAAFGGLSLYMKQESAILEFIPAPKLPRFPCVTLRCEWCLHSLPTKAIIILPPYKMILYFCSSCKPIRFSECASIHAVWQSSSRKGRTPHVGPNIILLALIA